MCAKRHTAPIFANRYRLIYDYDDGSCETLTLCEGLQIRGHPREKQYAWQSDGDIHSPDAVPVRDIFDRALALCVYCGHRPDSLNDIYRDRSHGWCVGV